MQPLCNRLQRHFGRVENWGYSSFSKSIDLHAQVLRNWLDGLSAEPTVHIVAHSMGAIIVRTALQLRELENLGRIVLLAPPNHGVPLARRASWLVGWACRCVPQLADNSDSFVNQLPKRLTCEFGIIRARHDFLVPFSSTGLENAKDQITVPGLHSTMLLKSETAEQCRHFLQTGHFDHASSLAVKN
jgi:pimeloyl-ACP methyl ester carboxylesterase